MLEQQQQAQLTKLRFIATALLLLMAFVFVIAKLFEPRYSYLAFVRAFAEAAMIGALADWFAVTALFKKPLGLPIPHTAIIQNNKDRIAESIAHFLENNFMTREVMSEELRQMDFSEAGIAWLQRPENSRALAQQVVQGMPALLRMFDDKDVGNFLQQRIASGVEQVRIAPLLGEIVAILIADRKHQELFDHLIRIVAEALEQNRPFIRQKIHESSPKWMPKTIDQKFFDRLVSECQNILDEMKQDDSQWRDRFQLAAEGWIEKLRNSPEHEEKLRAVIAGMVHNPLFIAYIGRVWGEVQQRLLADAAAPHSVAVDKLDQAMRALALALERDAALRSKLNRWIQTFATDVIVKRRGVIAGLVKRVIQKWDGATIARKFELQVGRDLQYIRINGTLVGGLVGVLLYSISLAL